MQKYEQKIRHFGKPTFEFLPSVTFDIINMCTKKWTYKMETIKKVSDKLLLEQLYNSCFRHFLGGWS